MNENVPAPTTDLLPRFHRKYAAGDEDLILVLWGDSLLAREYHTSPGDVDPRALPPMMHTRKLDWHLWQCLDYEKPLYRRCDYPGYFALRGSWTATEVDDLWDDSGYRPAITYFSQDRQASFSWTVAGEDVGSAFSLIFRSDELGAEAVLGVAEGAGAIEVYDEGCRSWMEAHGYRFSQRQVSSGPRQGNTTYQRRLALRKAAASARRPVTLTVAKAGADESRLLLWGVELYRRERGVLRLVNAARGSHTLEMLARSMDNEVLAFRPDLILLELPLLNMVHQQPTVEYSVNWVWDVVWGDRPGAENDWALLRRGADRPDLLLILPHHSLPHLNPDGSFADLGGGVTAGDIYDSVRSLIAAKGDMPCLDMAAAFLEAIAADPAFANPYQAMLASSPTGETYTTDGVHQNDRGTGIYARALCSLLAKSD